jgi:hypothetical protein
MIGFEDGVGGVAQSYSSFVPARSRTKIAVCLGSYQVLSEKFAKRIRIQNLRFAHSLCAAQFLSSAARTISSHRIVAAENRSKRLRMEANRAKSRLTCQTKV